VTLALGLWAAPAAERSNVMLVSLDQCRADRLHVYGNARPTSPNLDRMAAEGVRFTRFYAVSPWTAPSYASMMTSQYPSRHGVTLLWPREVPALSSETPVLAELFRKAGYRTGAFVNNSVAGAYLTARGFEDYDEGQRRPPSITERTGLRNPEFQAPATTDRVLQWLEANQARPFFLFLLYFEPHSPYDPPPEHDLFRSDAYPEETNTGWDVKTGRLFRWANLGDGKAIERLMQLYDGKIHFVDRHFGRVLEHLRRSGLDRKTVVFLTSDHGELLYSHPEDYLTFDHRSLYDEVMHIPALVWGAGIPGGREARALASHIDIAPTLLELAGLAAMPDAQGKSLVPDITGRGRARRYVFGEQDILEPLRSVRDERSHLILNLRSGRTQLFGDRRDAALLRAALNQWRRENEPPAAEQERRWRELVRKTPREQILDEVTTGAHLQLSGGGWEMADEERNYRGGCYWAEGAAAATRTAVWRTDNPLLGRYRISIWYGGLPQGGVASDTGFTVGSRGGEKTFRVDQTKNLGAWMELGVFEDPVHVTLTNQADGRVIVDAVKFERLE
jgi:arylsulfatase A-like enzyme